MGPHNAVQKVAETISESRQPGAGTIEPGFDDVVADHFEHDDQPDRPQQHVPAGVNGERQHDRKDGGDHRPEIGDEAHHRGHRAPQRRAGYSDEPQPDRHRHAVAGVHHQLHDQVFADARAGLVHRVRGAMQVAAEQTQQSAAQLLTVDQDEKQEDQHDAGAGERSADRPQPLAGLDHRRGWGLDDLYLLGCSPARRSICRRILIDLLLDDVDGCHRAVQHAGFVQPFPKLADLVLDRRPVGRQLCAQVAHLIGQERPRHYDQAQGQSDHHHHGQDARHPNTP